MAKTAVAVAAAALFACASAAGAGPRAEKVKLSPGLGRPEAVVAYDRSRLLLVGDYNEPTLRRIYDDGSVDRSFGDGGTVEIDYYGLSVAPDGKILLTGAGSSPDHPENSDAEVTRLLPNGRPDPSFGVDGTARVDFGGRYDGGAASAVAANGDVLLGGSKQTFAADRGGSDATPAVARLHPNGSLDRSFGDDGIRILGGGGESGVLEIAPTPQGGIVAEGEAYLGTAVWKLGVDGAVDRHFGKRGVVEIEGHGKRERYGWEEETELVDDLVVLPSGKLLLAGTGNLYDGADSQYRAVAVRLRGDGSVDRSYGKRGWAVAKIAGSTFVEGMASMPGGRLLLAASSQNHHDKRSDVGALVLGPGGHPDPRFGNRGRLRVDLVGWDLAESVAAQGNRAVILGQPGKGGGRWLVRTPPIG